MLVSSLVVLVASLVAPAATIAQSAPCPSATAMPDASQPAARGIAICAYPRALINTIAVIRSLRALGTRLPVEVFHNDELTDQHAHFLEQSDAQTSVRRTGLPQSAGWLCKLHAAMHSSFGQVLVMDVDVAPLMDLALLFDTTEYRQTGTLFFYDWNCPHYTPIKPTFLRKDMAAFDRRPYEHLAVLTRTGLPNPYPSPQLLADLAFSANMTSRGETSVFLLDRCRQPRLCAIIEDKAEWLAANGYGDKDVFWQAAELAGTDYAFSRYSAGGWGYRFVPSAQMRFRRGQKGAEPAKWISFAMFAHFDPTTGGLAFMHGEKHNKWISSKRDVVSAPKASRAFTFWNAHWIGEEPTSASYWRFLLIAQPRPLRNVYIARLNERVRVHLEVERLAKQQGVHFCGAAFNDANPTDRSIRLQLTHENGTRTVEATSSQRSRLKPGCDDDTSTENHP